MSSDWVFSLSDPHREIEPSRHHHLVDHERQSRYGEPTAHMQKVAEVWKALFGWETDAHTVAIAMVAFKLVRETHEPYEDNRVDAMGYLEIARRCSENK